MAMFVWVFLLLGLIGSSYEDIYPESNSCGISPAKTTRIIGGEDAQPGAWPWIASLQQYYQHICGGTLVAPKWVLTASHCVGGINERTMKTFRIKLGLHKMNHLRDEPSVQVRHIVRMIKNPHWNIHTLHGDQTLLELDSPVQLNSRVNLPCFPKKDVYPPLGKVCVLAGWGSIAYPERRKATVLQQTRLPVVPGKTCYYNDNVVCVGKGKGKGPDGKQWPNACRGDSGGPLVCQRADGRWQLDGVASFVYTYCKYYTGYSPVNKYVDWIHSITKS